MFIEPSKDSICCATIVDIDCDVSYDCGYKERAKELQMSVDTKVILFGNPNAEEIAQVIKATYGFEPTYRLAFNDDPSYVIMNFPEPNADKKAETRRLNIHFGISDHADVYDGPATQCSLGCWGSSIGIMEALARKFGGFVCDSDSVGEWRPISREASDTAAEVVVAEIAPIDELNLALSKALATAAAIQIREVAKDPVQFAALMSALDDYRSKVGSDI